MIRVADVYRQAELCHTGMRMTASQTT